MPPMKRFYFVYFLYKYKRIGLVVKPIGCSCGVSHGGEQLGQRMDFAKIVNTNNGTNLRRNNAAVSEVFR